MRRPGQGKRSLRLPLPSLRKHYATCMDRGPEVQQQVAEGLYCVCVRARARREIERKVGVLRQS